MDILQIYSQYQIPTNLQTHMLRVAAVGKIITDHLQIPIDKDLVVNTLLLHDMGNVIKFDFSRPELLDEADTNRLDEIKAMQQSFITKYGHDCDLATVNIMKELKVPITWIELCARSHGDHTNQFLNTDDYPAKIAFYSDMRVGPKGILDMNTRFADLIARNPQEKNKLTLYQTRCQQIESQLQAVVDIDLHSITDATVAPVIESLKTTEII